MQQFYYQNNKKRQLQQENKEQAEKEVSLPKVHWEKEQEESAYHREFQVFH